MTLLKPVLRLRAVDWQLLAGDVVQGLYRDEIERWQRLLDWDTSGRWQEIERRRRQGAAPGLAVLDEAGAVVAWTHYAVRRRVLTISTFNAATDAAAALMMERLLNASALTYVDRVSLFAFSEYGGLVQALRNRGLHVDRYWYLGRDTVRATLPMLPGLRSWRESDVRATAGLLERAYGRGDDTRPFAPGHTPDEWLQHLTELAGAADGCTVLSEASFCLPAGPERLAAAIIVTRIAEGTAHVAHVLVDPQMRRRRLASQLLELASAGAARAGCGRLTVTVGGSNRAGRSLLEGLRFRAMGSFLAAGALQQRQTAHVPQAVALGRR